MNMARENSHLVTDYQGLSPHGGSNVDGASIPKAGDVVGPIGSTAETNTSISSAPRSSHLGSPREQEFYKAYKRAALREEAGLPEDVIRSCLRMKKHNAASRFNSNELACADDEENHKLCSICMVGYESGDEIGMLWYCAHEYHADCLKKWLVKKNTCPCCRGLALIPPWFEDWKGKDLRAHQLFFEQFLTGKMI